jgi:peptidyl-prolyl cis-trans isomerase D
MITEMRREIKKFTPFLWLVLISMVLGYASMLFIKVPGKKDLVLATVNSTPLYLHEYKQSLLQSQIRLQQMQQEAARQGVDPELVLQLLGMRNPEEEAFNSLVRFKLLDRIVNTLHLGFDTGYLEKEIAKSIPLYFIDRQTGQVKEKEYAAFLQQLSMTIPEYEESKENDIKRGLMVDIIKQAAYVPQYVLKSNFEKKHSQKSFSIFKLSYESFLEKAKAQPVNEAELEKYFEQHKESYIVPEKRRANYWVFNQEDYRKQVQVDDGAIEAYYNRYKDEKYRTPAEIKVRRILIKADSKNPKSLDAARGTINEIYGKISAEPSLFEKLAREHSQDAKTASRGGMSDFFKRGTYDNNFETAAFRLINPGSLSAPVQTSEGFELAQLVERKGAQYKDLESVKEDIIKVIRLKKALSLLRGDLEQVKHEMRTDKDAIATFAARYKVASKSTGFALKSDAKKITDEGAVIEKLFARGREAEANYGFFERGLTIVFYQETGREPSHTPALSQVRGQVLEAYHAHQAQETSDKEAAQLQSKLLEGQETFSALAAQYGEKVQETGLIGPKEQISAFGKVPGLSEQAFELSDGKQLLVYKYDDSSYFVRLKETKLEALPDSAAAFGGISGQEEKTQQSLYFEAFIASLMRNAKIERKEITGPVGGPIDLGLDN